LAIRERLKQSGHLGGDQLTIKATDRNSGQTYDLALAPGDRVRLFDRVFDARTGGRDRVLGNNGDVVTVLALDDRGMRVRGERGEGVVAWSKIREHKGEPVRLTYGYATTIETAQGSTVREHIVALPSGSRSVSLFKGYTAASRHEHAAWIVIDEAAERRDISRRIPLGEHRPIREHDIWRNIGENLSRTPEKATALDLLGRATGLRRGGLRGLQVAGERQERQQAMGIDLHHARELHQKRRLAQKMDRLTELAREMPAIVAERAREMRQTVSRGLGLGR
jgi:hypothetical protein